MSKIQPTKSFLEDLLHDSGKILLNYFQNHFAITEKGNNLGIVTDADFASEDFIKKKINKHFPSHNILAEETGLTNHAANDNSVESDLWIIDPLDGTTNFSKGNPYFCISIAYGKIKNNRFCAQLTGILQPTTQSMYIAERNNGSTLNSKPIQVSPSPDFKLASIVTGFSSNKGDALLPLVHTIATIQNKSLGLRINGAAALDLAMTASGVFQGFFETPLSAWDTAAGALLITEAGGKVTNFFGDEFCPLNDRGIIGSNYLIFPELLEIIKDNYLK